MQEKNTSRPTTGQAPASATLSVIETLGDSLLLRWMHAPGLPAPQSGRVLKMSTDLGVMEFGRFNGGKMALWGSANVVPGSGGVVFLIVIAHSGDLTEEERESVRATIIGAHRLDMARQADGGEA